jgi:NitT/TauT family transport system substrate-binding protein
MKASLAASFAVGASGLLAACGDDSDSSESSGGGGDLQPLSVMMPFPLILNFIGDCAGISGGYFADHGVEVDLQFAQTAPQAMQQLAAGNVSVVRTAPIAIAAAVGNEGAPFIGVGMPVQQIVYVIVSAPDDPRDSLESLVGGTVGFPQLASNAEETFDLVLRSAGIDPESIDREAVGVEATAYALIEEGRVDAIWATRESASTMEVMGLGPHIAEVEDANPLLGVALASTNDAVESEGDVIADYLAGLDASFRAIRDEATLDELIPVIREDWDLPQLDDPESVKPVIATISDMWFAAGEENLLYNIPEAWETGVAEFQRLGIVPEDSAPTDFYTNDLWEQALG